MESLITVQKRYKVFYGGRGGAKSWACARAIIIKCLQGKIRVLCTRELQRSIADSVNKLLSDQINELGLSACFRILKASIESATGSEIIFAGLHNNVQEIKSMEGVDICWVEEAQRVSEESWQVLVPTIRKDGSEIWATFNPDSIDDPTYKRFVVNPIDDSVVVKTTYLDNPYFPEVLRREMEYDKKYNYQKYLHIWEGEPRVMTEAQVFAGKFRVDVFDSPAEDEVTYYYGADWGFARDPSVLVRCYVHDGTLYIDHEAHGVGVDIDKTPAMFDTVPGARRYEIVADSARPETISYMNKNGFRVLSARKGKGSVEDGIERLKSFKEVVIHERCGHTADEFKYYSYKVDKFTGRVLPVLVDAHNHCIDALRYALEGYAFGIDDVAFGVA